MTDHLFSWLGNSPTNISLDMPIYAELTEEYVVNKAEEAHLYGVNERSITRDIDDIRKFLNADSEHIGIVKLRYI